MRRMREARKKKPVVGVHGLADCGGVGLRAADTDAIDAEWTAQSQWQLRCTRPTLGRLLKTEFTLPFLLLFIPPYERPPATSSNPTHAHASYKHIKHAHTSPW
jgi:hypothetical protein